MFVSHCQTAGQNYIKVLVANKSVENVAELKKHRCESNKSELMSSRQNSGNACYYSESFVLPSAIQKHEDENKNKIILPMFCVGVKLGLKLWEEEMEDV
jgi:hypothetical protein